MLLLTILFTTFFRMAWSQTPCEMSSTTSTFKPVVLRYTPFMTPQIAPTSTIWETEITTLFNAVDCRYVTPLRVDENPAAEGPFTTYVRSPTLTVTRVACMPETTAVTRREIRGENQIELRTIGLEHNQKIHKRGTAQENIDQVASDMSNTSPPDLTSLTVQAYLYLTSVNTAIFAINLIQAGTDLDQTCTQLRDPASQAKLFRTTIDPVQAGDIVCFAATNGLYFPEPITEIITYLEDLIYAIQARSTYSDDSNEFCWSLEPIDSPWLGIDIEGVTQYLCPDSSVTIGPIPTTTATPTLSTGTVVETVGTIIGTIAGPPTGGPYANSTALGATGGSGYGANSSVFSATASPAPYANSTIGASSSEYTTDAVGTIGSYGTSVIFPNATYTGIGTGTVPVLGTATAAGTGNLPSIPASVLPEIESVSPTPTRRFRKW